MRHATVVALSLVPLLVSCDRQVRLDATSLFALHQSSGEMKKELRLSKAQAAALEGAIDVLVGDALREQVASAETAAVEPLPAARIEAEARVLAPVDGLSFSEVIAAASDRTHRELEGLLAELGEREAMATEHQKSLDRISVVRAGYGMSLATRRSWIDLTVHNGTDETLREVLLDCRLVEGGRETREKGTCSAVFPNGLAPGVNGLAQAYVGWETEPRPSRRVEAWPIRAYGARRAVLWEVPSQLDPREAGPIGDIKNRVAVVDSSLRSLQVDLPIEDGR